MTDVLRLVAGGLIALCVSYVGLCIKRRYQKRAVFFKSATDFTSVLTTELVMRKTPMPEIVQKFLQGRQGEFENALLSGSRAQKRAIRDWRLLKRRQFPFSKPMKKRKFSTFLTAWARPCSMSNLRTQSIIKTCLKRQKQSAKTRQKDWAQRISNCACCSGLP